MYCPKCSYNNPPGIKSCRNCEIDLQPDPGSTDDSAASAPILYAELNSRIFAALLDGLLLLLLLILMLAGVAVLIAMTGDDSVLHDTQWITRFIWTYSGLALACLLLMDTRFVKASPGKRWLNLRIQDLQGKSPGFWRAAWRMPLRMLSAIFFPILLLHYFTPRRQALHDLLAGTLVIKTTDNNKISALATLLVLLMALLIPMLALAATMGKPYFQQYLQHVQLRKAAESGYLAAAALTRYYQRNGHVPATFAETGALVLSPHVAEISSSPQSGEITLTLSNTVRRDIRNKHLTFTPAMTSEGQVVWSCHSMDLENRLAPENCILQPHPLNQ